MLSSEYKGSWRTASLGLWNRKDIETLPLFCFCFFRSTSYTRPTWPFRRHLCHHLHLPSSLSVQIPERKLGSSSTFQVRVQVTWAANCGRGWVVEGMVTQWCPFSSNHEYGSKADLPDSTGNSCFNESELEKLGLSRRQSYLWWLVSDAESPCYLTKPLWGRGNHVKTARLASCAYSI